MGGHKWNRLLEEAKASAEEWTVRTGDSTRREAAERYIEENLGADSPATRLSIADNLRRLSVWHAVHGQVALLQGRDGGWIEIHRAWMYRCLALRLSISEFQKGRVLGKFRPVGSLQVEASDCAWALLYALAVSSDFEARFFGETLRAMLIDKDIVPVHYWRHGSRGLEPFSVQLFSLSRNESPDVPNLSACKTVYQAIVDAWAQQADLGRALYAACDFHCERIVDTTRANEEFRRPPFDLVAAEILAVFTIRKALHLDTPSVDHPLLASPFNDLSGRPSDIEDTFLRRVAEMCE